MDGNLVTVLLPVFNGQSYIEESLSSILCQSLERFTLLVLDDGSTDATSAIVETMKDPRLRFVRSRENRGLVATLNAAIEMTTTPYAARMDADDVARPERLRCQLSFMESHPEVGVLGSAVSILGTGELRSYPPTDSAIRVAMLGGSPFAHPTVMYRTELVRASGYDNRYAHAEDFNLWVDLCDRTRFANLGEPLLRYRLHGGQISARRLEEQARTRDRIIGKYLGKLFGAPLSDADILTHLSLIGLSRAKETESLETWIGELRRLATSGSALAVEDIERFIVDSLLRRLKDVDRARISRRILGRVRRILS